MLKRTGIIVGCFAAVLVLAGPSVWTLITSPTTEVFNGISSPNGYFTVAVGENGAIVHFNNGEAGTLVPSGTTNELYDVYVASESMAIATGEDIVLLWDGISWEAIFNDNQGSIYTGAWITPEQDVAFYGLLGNPFNIICPHIPGAAQQPFCRAYPSPMLTACGVSGDIKLITGSGDIYHHDNFLGEPSGQDPIHDEAIPLFLTAVWVPGWACLPGSVEPLSLYAIRTGNEFWHFDGSDWSDMGVTLPGDQTMTWLGGLGDNKLIAVGFKPDGGGGNQGVVWTYDGASWTEDTNLPSGTPGLTDVVAHLGRPDDIFSQGFETSTVFRMGMQERADILASAEEGNFLITADLFPETASDISVDKTLLTPGPYNNGDQIQFQIVVFNHGPATAVDFRVVDGYLDSIQYVSGTCNTEFFNMQAGWVYRDTRIPSLAPNQSHICTMTFNVVGPVMDEIRNYAAIAETNEVNYDNNQSQVRGIFIE